MRSLVYEPLAKWGHWSMGLFVNGAIGEELGGGKARCFVCLR